MAPQSMRSLRLARHPAAETLGVGEALDSVEQWRRPTQSPDRAIRVVYADDSFLMRQALEAVLERLDGVDAVAGCVDGDTLLAAVEEQRPDVVVTDMRMPPSGDREGIRIAHRLRQLHPSDRRRGPHAVRGAALRARAARGGDRRGAATC